METLTDVLVIVHLLAMAGFIAAYAVQRTRPPRSTLTPLWAWCVLIMTISGFSLLVASTMAGHQHGHIKMITKGVLMTLLGVTVLVVYFRRRTVSRTVPNALAGAVVAEVAVSVLLT